MFILGFVVVLKASFDNYSFQSYIDIFMKLPNKNQTLKTEILRKNTFDDPWLMTVCDPLIAIYRHT